MYHTIESLADSLGVSTLVLQRRAVKLGIWTRDGIADEDVQQLEFLRVTPSSATRDEQLLSNCHSPRAIVGDATKVENVTSPQELTVEPVASENENLIWYGEFLNGKPLYRRANEKPKSKGTVVATKLWEFADDSYVTPTFKERQATF